jgi:tyrosine-protein kinase Etk/Wzc
MGNNYSINQTNNGKSFDGLFLLALLFKYKIFIIIVLSVVFIVSIIISLLIPNEYTATVNTVPPKRNIGSLMENAMGNISSTLKEFGLTKFGGQGSEGYSYLVILNSRSVKDSMINKFNLAKVYDLPDSLRYKILKQLEDNLDIELEPLGNYTISVTDNSPARAADMANYYISISNFISERIFHTEAIKSREFIESRLNSIDSTLEVVSDSLEKYSSKTFLFSPLDQATSISKAYADIKAELIQQEIMQDLLKNRFGENDPYTLVQKELIDNIRSKLSTVENRPGFAGNFPLKNATAVGIEYLRLYTTYETFSKVKGFLLPMLEDAKLDETRETTSLLIVDTAEPPEKKSGPKRSLIVLGSEFGAFILSVMFILLLNGYRNLKIRYNDYVSGGH